MGNTIKHLPWEIEKLNFTNSTIIFLRLLIGPEIVGYKSEIFSMTTNTKAISIIWTILFLMFLYTIRNFRL